MVNWNAWLTPVVNEPVAANAVVSDAAAEANPEVIAPAARPVIGDPRYVATTSVGAEDDVKVHVAVPAVVFANIQYARIS